MNLKQLLQKRRIATPKYWVGVFILLALLGFADAAYLAVEHWQGELPDCSVIEGCEEVLSSKYSAIGPIPVASLGSLYYLSLVLFSVMYFDTGQARWAYMAGYMTWLGLGASIGLVGLMAWVIGAYCQYCLLSALSSGLLFIWARFWMRALGRAAVKESQTAV